MKKENNIDRLIAFVKYWVMQKAGMTTFDRTSDHNGAGPWANIFRSDDWGYVWVTSNKERGEVTIHRGAPVDWARPIEVDGRGGVEQDEEAFEAVKEALWNYNGYNVLNEIKFYNRFAVIR